MTDKITLEQARGLLARAVLTQGPDFVYLPPLEARTSGVGCWNVPITDGLLAIRYGKPVPQERIPQDSPRRKTGCLVGTAMKLSGVVPEEQFPIGGPSHDFRMWADDLALVYMRIAQTSQDNGEPWGEAYNRAEEWAASRAGSDD